MLRISKAIGPPPCHIAVTAYNGLYATSFFLKSSCALFFRRPAPYNLSAALSRRLKTAVDPLDLQASSTPRA